MGSILRMEFFFLEKHYLPRMPSVGKTIRRESTMEENPELFSCDKRAINQGDYYTVVGGGESLLGNPRSELRLREQEEEGRR